MNRLVLIDGNAIMHRAYHALPPLTTPDGKVVNVVYGFVSMILKIFHDLKPSHMTVAFDRPGPTFREKLYKAYQAQRPKMEDDFVSQIPIVHEMVTAFGIPIYEKDGFEADDVIGTIVAHVIPGLTRDPSSASNTGFRLGGRNDKKAEIDQVIIVTGDRDILQLVEDEKVMVYMPTKGLSEGRLYGEKEVMERMGVSPGLIVDLKALMGDQSDNYPGVAGVGPKTAITLLQEYGSLEGIYEGIEGTQGNKSSMGVKIKEKLTEGKKSALLGKELATIRKDAPITFEEKSARIEILDTPGARKALETLHFPSLLKRLHGQIKKQRVENIEKKSTEQQELF